MDDTLEQQIITSLTSIKLQDEPQIIALRINDILSKVLSYLPLKDLKKTRQVNQLWKDESQKYFKSRALVDLSTPDFWFRTDYKDFMEANKCQVNFNILNFMPGPPDNTNFNFLASTLKSIQHLEELNLQIDLRNEVVAKKDWMKDFALLEPFSHLKKFQLRLTCCWKFSDSDRLILEQFFKKLLQLTPNLNVLGLNSFSRWKRADALLHKKFYLEEIVKMQMEWESAGSKGPKPFQNLSCFEIHVNLAEQLMELSQPIKKLSIVAIVAEGGQHSLQELLKKHAKTLESFEFKFLSGELQNLGPIWNIDFPKLQRIRFQAFNPRGRQEQPPHIPNAFEFEMFRMVGEKFKEKFPSLRSFSWKDESETFLSRICEIILPRPNPDVEFCFPQITSFDICKSSRLEDTDEEYSGWMNRLANMFPNVYNPEFNRARSQ